MGRFRDPPVWAVFLFCTVGWAVLTPVVGRLLDPEVPSTAMAFAAPGFGAAMAGTLHLWKRREQEATGLPATAIVPGYAALQRGELPADRSTWPAVRLMIDRRARQLRMQRWLAVVWMPFLALWTWNAIANGGGAHWVFVGFGVLMLVTLPVSLRHQHRRLDQVRRRIDGHP